MNNQKNAENEVIKFFFHTKNETEITKICNNLKKYNKQNETDTKSIIENLINNLEEFRSTRFHSSNFDFQKSCNNYDFYSTIANPNYITSRYFKIYIEKLTFCLLDIDKDLNNLSLDKHTIGEIKTFINEYIKLLHLYLDLSKKAQDIQKQIESLNKKGAEHFGNIVADTKKSNNVDTISSDDILK